MVELSYFRAKFWFYNNLIWFLRLSSFSYNDYNLSVWKDCWSYTLNFIVSIFYDNYYIIYLYISSDCLFLLSSWAQLAKLCLRSSNSWLISAALLLVTAICYCFWSYRVSSWFYISLICSWDCLMVNSLSPRAIYKVFKVCFNSWLSSVSWLILVLRIVS